MQWYWFCRCLPSAQSGNFSRCGVGIHSGKGNPHNENGINVSYMWEDILKKDTVLYLIDKIIFLQKEAKKDPDTGKRVTKETLIYGCFCTKAPIIQLILKNFFIVKACGGNSPQAYVYMRSKNRNQG